MTNDLSKRFHSQDPEDVAWRVEAARVDAAIEGLVEDPEIRAYREELNLTGLTADEKIALIGERFFPVKAG